MNWIFTTKIAGTLAIIAGVAIYYIISRRKFKRRTITGAEVFTSYEKSKLIPLTEGLGKVIALILFIGGIMLLIIAIT